MTSYERNANRLTVFLLVLLAGLAVFGVIRLSGPIPIHFNGKGEANRWGSPSTLLVLAFVGGSVVALLWLIRSTPTELMNFPGPRTPTNIAQQRQNFDQLLATVRVIVAGLFLAIISQIIWVSSYHLNRVSLWPSFLFISLIFLSVLVSLIRGYQLSAGR
ncbi:DUF1648 domain-containing protein [Spirosoma oryzicola]|uniref:DUF1648 domain-containing protein n=1 Tax=Spirosoma oryzicola TaxID=2898794 RepID=UPI001E3FCA55|nr:DUF1648 domain-containing protein [Spirosoma oryzicola]UHG92184.1 DUF1648 domain-containing protein [Spirosoma oryzicola]